MPEKNEGYEIIAVEVYRETNSGQQDRIVLGRMTTRFGTKFVTWSSTIWPLKDGNKIDYFWGHYFEDGAAAYADYHKRLLEKYER